MSGSGPAGPTALAGRPGPRPGDCGLPSGSIGEDEDREVFQTCRRPRSALAAEILVLLG